MTNILLLGAGSMSGEILWYVKEYLHDHISDYNFYFFDDNKQGINHYHHILNTWKEVRDLEPNLMIGFATWNAERKLVLYDKLIKKGLDKYLTSFVPKTNTIHSSVDIETGCFIAPKVFISPSVKLGKCVTLNVGTSLFHHVKIGDFTNISTFATLNGAVNVGKNCFIGSNAVISNNVNIGDNVFITIGALVTNDVPSNTKVVGVNGRYFKQKG